MSRIMSPSMFRPISFSMPGMAPAPKPSPRRVLFPPACGVGSSVPPCRSLHATRQALSSSSSTNNGAPDVDLEQVDGSVSSRLPPKPSVTEILDESEIVGTEVDDMMTSFKGASQVPFPKRAADVLLAPINEDDVEMLPDGTPYLPEIKFRRILLKAFGPGGWGLVPRGKHTLVGKNLSREYALFVQGRFVSQARGETDMQSNSMTLATAAESVRSDALKRCCKDIGIASELWDPVWTRKWKAKRATLSRR
ncbi:mitochondrial genome maintenance MGM101-domain-containing protein [Hyaloraphidium curvatum]|nr:mitochondrial genome maintenance MGM101-domain-containing protein [Hyaloraphidium curvatum]